MLHRILSLEEKLDSKHTALLVIDVQNDFCDPNGFFPNLGIPEFADSGMMPQMGANLLHLLESARNRQILLVFVRGIYDPVYASGPVAERWLRQGRYGKFCLQGSWGADFWGDIRPKDSLREVAVIKHRYSAFFGTDMDLILRSNDIRTLVITGGATGGCVRSTAHDGFFNGYYIVVASDCTFDYATEFHNSGLRDLERLFGRVILSSEIMKIWAAQAAKEEQPVARKGGK